MSSQCLDIKFFWVTFVPFIFYFIYYMIITNDTKDERRRNLKAMTTVGISMFPFQLEMDSRLRIQEWWEANAKTERSNSSFCTVFCCCTVSIRSRLQSNDLIWSDLVWSTMWIEWERERKKMGSD